MPRTVISTMADDGTEMIGPAILLWHVPHNDIFSGSLLTVESNHFAVLKSRGAVLQVYETGQYPIQTGDRPLIGGVQQAFYSGQSPWQFEVLYINRSKLILRAEGQALSKDLITVKYAVSYYVHVESREHVLQLIQHMPVHGHTITSQDLSVYAWPIIEQELNHFIQITPVAEINEKIGDITQLVGQQVQAVLTVYGITLDDVRVSAQPVESARLDWLGRMNFGLSIQDIFRFDLANRLAAQGVVSAPNAAVGKPYRVGAVRQYANAGSAVGEAGSPPVEPVVAAERTQ